MRTAQPTHVGSALILLSHLLTTCAASPADVEIDLVSLVANETYKHIWPFLIIFAARNASQLWQENDEIAPFQIDWSLSGYLDESDFITGGRRFGSGRWWSLTEPGPRPDDGVRMVFGSPNSKMINGTERVFLLDYNTMLINACPPNSSVRSRPVYASDQITFYLDPDSTRLPDFTDTASSCPVSITNFEFDGLGNSLGERCMKMAPTREADPCGLQQNEEDLANRTRTAVLEFASCPNGTWPDLEGILSPRFCNAPRSSSTARDFNGKLLASSVLASIITMESMY